MKQKSKKRKIFAKILFFNIAFVLLGSISSIACEVYEVYGWVRVAGGGHYKLVVAEGSKSEFVFLSMQLNISAKLAVYEKSFVNAKLTVNEKFYGMKANIASVEWIKLSPHDPLMLKNKNYTAFKKELCKK